MEELILALFMPSTYYDAWSLRKAMQVGYLISYHDCVLLYMCSLTEFDTSELAVMDEAQ
jgi:hypothetical protein